MFTPDDIPGLLAGHFTPVHNSFIDQTGLYETGFYRALALILSQGGDPASASIENRLARLTSDHADPIDLPVTIVNSPAFFNGLSQRARATLTNFLQASGDGRLHFDSLRDVETAFETLLSIRGVGLETTENILLYALNLPFVPVNAGLYRIANRHGYIPEESEREEVRSFYASFFPDGLAAMRQTHQQLLQVARLFCKASAPCCANCPLGAMMQEYQQGKDGICGVTP